MVAYKLETVVYFGMEDKLHKRHLPSSSYNHNTLTTLRTCEGIGILQMHFKVADSKHVIPSQVVVR